MWSGARIRPASGPYLVSTTTVAVENTHNFGGGTVQPLDRLLALRALADEHGLFLHLDGARLWNAHVASGIALAAYGTLFDTVSVCFSKGLGAPVGSMLVSSAERIAEARVWRKRYGGGMRQVGVLAAACTYALDQHVHRLAEDHAHAPADRRGLRRRGADCGRPVRTSTPTSSRCSSTTPPGHPPRSSWPPPAARACSCPRWAHGSSGSSRTWRSTTRPRSKPPTSWLGSSPRRRCGRSSPMCRHIGRRNQAVSATPSGWLGSDGSLSRTSAGVCQSRVRRGRLFSLAATWSR